MRLEDGSNTNVVVPTAEGAGAAAAVLQCREIFYDDQYHKIIGISSSTV